jgi:hypothetical protein
LSRDACVWTSDLAFTAPVAAAWRASEAFGGREVHSVRRLAELRLLIWFVVAAWATRMFLREGRPEIASAHLAWLAIVGMDPGNTLYLATFYSEAAAAFGAYLCVTATIVAMLRPTRVALFAASLGACMLAGSKLQHVILPILLGICVFVAGGRTSRRAALAVVIGGLLGCTLQLGNQARDTWMNRDVAMVNRMDYVLTVLLEDTSDRDRVAATMKLDDECVSQHGKNVFEIDMPSEKACPNHAEWRKTTMWWLLLSDPAAIAHAAARVPSLLLPWLPAKLGVVEDTTYGRLPETTPSISSLFGSSEIAAGTILVAPWLILLVCALRRASERARAFALICAVGSASVCAVALLGDGTVDYAKHAQLALNFALGAWLLPLAALLVRPANVAVRSDATQWRDSASNSA